MPVKTADAEIPSALRSAGHSYIRKNRLHRKIVNGDFRQVGSMATYYEDTMYKVTKNQRNNARR